MNKTINKPVKPLSVAREEFCHSLLDLVNNSGLPAFSVQSIFADFQNMIANAAKEQFERENAEYQKQLKEYEAKIAEANNDEVHDAT